jgi:hypothetical protein
MNNIIDKLIHKNEYLEKQRKYAWAKYYSEVNKNHELTLERYNKMITIIKDQGIPIHIKNEIEEMAEQLKKEYQCPVCLNIISKGELDITGCGHKYCKDCLEQLKKQPLPKCAVCRKGLH